MTRKKFEKLYQDKGFDYAMEELYSERDDITLYEQLKNYIIQNIKADSNQLALHLLKAIYYSEGDSNWYYYDYCAGTTCTPKCLNNTNDIEQYIGFDKE